MDTLDIDECAAFLKVDRSTALKLAGNGTILGAKIGRAWVFLKDDLVDYLRSEARRQATERAAEHQPQVKTVLVAAPMARRNKRAAPDLSAYPDLTTA